MVRISYIYHHSDVVCVVVLRDAKLHGLKPSMAIDCRHSCILNNDYYSPLNSSALLQADRIRIGWAKCLPDDGMLSVQKSKSSNFMINYKSCTPQDFHFSPNSHFGLVPAWSTLRVQCWRWCTSMRGFAEEFCLWNQSPAPRRAGSTSRSGLWHINLLQSILDWKS